MSLENEVEIISVNVTGSFIGEADKEELSGKYWVAKFYNFRPNDLGFRFLNVEKKFSDKIDLSIDFKTGQVYADVEVCGSITKKMFHPNWAVLAPYTKVVGEN